MTSYFYLRNKLLVHSDAMLVKTIWPSDNKFSLIGSGYDIAQKSGAVYDLKTTKYYDITINCTDGENNIYSNFQVYVNKNDAPYFTNLPGNYLYIRYTTHAWQLITGSFVNVLFSIRYMIGKDNQSLPLKNLV